MTLSTSHSEMERGMCNLKTRARLSLASVIELLAPSGHTWTVCSERGPRVGRSGPPPCSGRVAAASAVQRWPPAARRCRAAVTARCMMVDATWHQCREVTMPICVCSRRVRQAIRCGAFGGAAVSSRSMQPPSHEVMRATCLWCWRVPQAHRRAARPPDSTPPAAARPCTSVGDRCGVQERRAVNGVLLACCQSRQYRTESCITCGTCARSTGMRVRAESHSRRVTWHSPPLCAQQQLATACIYL
jgi:hypothetical protein